METINLKVRKETVICAKCKKENHFLYLSDFIYGERLILYDAGKKYAYINLIKDDVYNEFSNLVNAVFEEYNKTVPKNLINDIFGIACDKIMSSEIDFKVSKRKCDECSSSVFEPTLIRPAQFVTMTFSVITHKNWIKLSQEQKKKNIINAIRHQNESSAWNPK